MPDSSAPIAKAALLALLKARPNLSDVLVSWAHPGQQAAPEFIFFGDTNITEEGRTLGNGLREEDYELEVWVVVHQEGDDPEAVEQRCYALYNELKATVSGQEGASDLGIVNGTSIRSVVAEITGANIKTFPEVSGWSVQAGPAIVSVTARIK